MLGTPRIYVHPVIHFLMRFLLLVNLSSPRRLGSWLTFSSIEYEVDRREHLQRDGPTGIYRVSTLLHWYQIASHPLVPFLRFVTYRMNSILNIRALSSPMFGVLSLFIKVGNPFVI